MLQCSFCTILSWLMFTSVMVALFVGLMHLRDLGSEPTACGVAEASRQYKLSRVPFKGWEHMRHERRYEVSDAVTGARLMTINTPSAERLILQPITTKTATSTASSSGPLTLRLTGCTPLCTWRNDKSEDNHQESITISQLPAADTESIVPGSKRFMSSWRDQVLLSTERMLPGRRFYAVRSGKDATTSGPPVTASDWELAAEAASSLTQILEAGNHAGAASEMNNSSLSVREVYTVCTATPPLRDPVTHPTVMMLFATIVLADTLHSNEGTLVRMWSMSSRASTFTSSGVGGTGYASYGDRAPGGQLTYANGAYGYW